MVDNNKVVQLNSHSGSTTLRGDDSHLFARFPAPFLAMKERGKKAIQPLLQTLFDNIDDALFELADRAEHNAEQNMYFESMREVRIKRRGMELGFSRVLDQAFQQFLAKSALPVLTNSASVGEISAENLTLVDDDELEELVAADSMVAKAERQFAVALKQLTIRLDTLIDSQAVNEKNNPFGPAVICQSFISVCRELELDVKAKLVLFKLFDRYVMSGLGPVYEQCNAALVEGGILPRLGQRTNSRAQAEIKGRSDLDVFRNLQNLLHRIPQSSLAVSSGLAAPGAAPQIPRDTLMQLLQIVQQSLMVRMEQQQQAAMQGIAPTQLNLQQALSGLLSEKMPSRSMSIGQIDDDAINLVAMLFQFILDDRNLAAPMKALIARLQIPIVKVAMLDKTFFSKGGHPARKLLNEIANACLGWNAGPRLERDPLYNKVSAVVNRLLNEFDGDTSIFQEILAEFVVFIEMDKRRTSLIEQRTVNAEDGKAKSELARSKVESVLNAKVSGKVLPKVVITLLEEAWSNVLFLIYLKEGENASNWQEALQVVDDLLWSVEPMGGPESRQRLLKIVPNLLKNLREGLTKIGYNPFDMNQLFADLEALHLAQLQEFGAIKLHDSSVIANVKQARAIEKTLDQLLEDRGGKEVSLEQLDAELEQQLAEFDALGDLVAQAVEDKSVVVGKPVAALKQEPVVADNLLRERVEQLVVSGAGTDTQSSELAELAEDDPCLQQVDGMAMGSWIELHQEDEKKFRCRLAAIIRPTGKYIFVNRSGMKVAEYSRISLACAIKQGVVATLDEGLLFDRALESVIGNLRNMKALTA